MTLIKSISGIRGTIGGEVGNNLTPLDTVKFTSAFATFLKRQSDKAGRIKVVVGRDARLSGPMIDAIVSQTLVGLGVDVVNIGRATTPTTELAVTGEKADGGIIITASHNPKQWNALKLLGSRGEFLSDAEGKQVLALAEEEDFSYAQIDDLGKITYDQSYNQKHIEKVAALKLVDVEAIEKSGIKVAIDCVNSVGGEILPQLLKRLGITDVTELNCEATGNFAHTPEPIPANLTQIADLMKKGHADVGFVVDPDVDRLAIICENGDMFGEEYTLVSVADYILSQTPGNTVSNLSSTRALKDVTVAKGGSYQASAVGEVNVVAKMKETGAIIGGEGNGGVIYPECHYGRDALVGIALYLTLMAKTGKKPTELKKQYPAYEISKNKIELTPGTDTDHILAEMKKKHANEEITDIDGVKIDMKDSWVHLRKSNTEPIIRIYSEAKTMKEAEELAQKIIAEIKALL